MISLLTLFIHYLTGFSFFKQKTQGEGPKQKTQGEGPKQKTQGEGPKQMTQGESKFKCKLSLCVFFFV